MQLSAPLPTDNTAPRAARDVLRELEERVGERALTDLLVIASELVASCVRYAGWAGSLSLSVEVNDGWIRIAVDRHAAHGSTPESLPMTTADGTDLRRGLRAVDTLARNWGIQQSADDTVVWAELPIG